MHLDVRCSSGCQCELEIMGNFIADDVQARLPGVLEVLKWSLQQMAGASVVIVTRSPSGMMGAYIMKLYWPGSGVCHRHSLVGMSRGRGWILAANPAGISLPHNTHTCSDHQLSCTAFELARHPAAILSGLQCPGV